MSLGTVTYKIENDKVVYRYDSSWIQPWTGAERTAALPQVSGNRMTSKSAVFKHPITGVDAYTVAKAIGVKNGDLTQRCGLGTASSS
jgi:hypothetical protein